MRKKNLCHKSFELKQKVPFEYYSLITLKKKKIVINYFIRSKWIFERSKGNVTIRYHVNVKKYTYVVAYSLHYFCHNIQSIRIAKNEINKKFQLQIKFLFVIKFIT